MNPNRRLARFARCRTVAPAAGTVAEAAGWCVYLLLCADGSLYCGITNRPAERFAAHCAGKGARYTRARGAEEMRIVCTGLSRSGALREEIRIKKLPRAAKLALWAAGSPLAAVRTGESG